MKFVYHNSTIELPDGSSARDLAEAKNQREPHQAIACTINSQPKDLSEPLREGDHVELLSFDDPRGKEIFWHSSAHILAQAVLRLYPNAKPTIGPPIEQGFYYDFANLQISENDLSRIEEEMEKIVKENYKPIKKTFASKEEAKSAFADNKYKLELIDSFEEGSAITAYEQGEFFDLCRGPHIASVGKVKAIKLTKTSGAYWRGDSKNEMLTRIYGITFPDKKLLKEYLTFLEEAKKRDHRVLGQKLDLFSFKDEAPGMPFIHPHGMIIWNKLIEFWRELHRERGYKEIKTPTMMCQSLWEKSGHWFYYKENMFTSEIEHRQFAIKPMNCPGCMLFFGSSTHSYRELPLRLSEIGHVHRYEASGAINGMFRVRSFHQDDAHLFMRPCDITAEITSILELVDLLYSTFGLTYHFELSTRPEKSMGTDEDWEVATEGLKKALDAFGKPYRINEGDGAFYGPKIDLHIRDALGRFWQCGTVQLDMSLPEQFTLEYTDHDGEKKRPIMLHRAIFGSIERFFGILVEHYAGKFPLWISPRQVTILTVADRHIEYAKQIKSLFEQHKLLCDIDSSQESISKKVRTAQLLQVNYILTVGDQEVQNNTVAVRTRDNVVHGEKNPHDLIAQLRKEIDEKRQAP